MDNITPPLCMSNYIRLDAGPGRRKIQSQLYAPFRAVTCYYLHRRQLPPASGAL